MIQFLLIFFIFHLVKLYSFEKVILPKNILKAAQKNRINEIEKFLQEGGNINSLTKEGNNSLLYIAVKNGHLELIKFLLEKHINIKMKYNPLGALIYFYRHNLFSFNKTIEMIKILVSFGADLNEELIGRVGKNYKIILPNTISAVLYNAENDNDLKIIDMLINLGAKFDPDLCIKFATVTNKPNKIIEYFKNYKKNLLLLSSSKIKECSLFPEYNEKICDLINEYI